MPVLRGPDASLIAQRLSQSNNYTSPLPISQPNRSLNSAIKLIHDHYNERLSLSNVARAVGYSVQHFHRFLVASLGITPQQYILQLRMRGSIQLFHDHPGITIERVAEPVGMDTSYFIRMFKRTYGSTPKQYVMENGSQLL